MKIQAKIRTFLAENLVTLRRAPVEMAVAAYLFVIGVLAQHHVFPYSGEQLLAGPIVLLLTFLCNKWFAKGWLRALYYLSVPKRATNGPTNMTEPRKLEHFFRKSSLSR